ACDRPGRAATVGGRRRRRPGRGPMTRIVIIGGGPAGYEAAIAAAQHEATVTLVDSDGVGGSAVLVDVVPSKSFIASSTVRTDLRRAAALGIELDLADAWVDMQHVNRRVKALAAAQSAYISVRLVEVGVEVMIGVGSCVYATHSH